jgi:choline-sulfatase
MGLFNVASTVMKPTDMDSNVGRVLGALEQAGLLDTTRVIYSSDHGENLGTRGLWARSTLFEESAGIPLIAAGPDIPQGAVVDTPVSLVDGFPTILQAVGAKADDADRDLPGVSLFDIANGAKPQRAVLTQYHASASISGSFAIRHENYKYIHYTGFAPMLFDMQADPFERNDLAGSSAYAASQAACDAALRTLLDPVAVKKRARADQTAMIERVGGKEKIIKRGSIHHSPPPSVAATLTPVERAE